MLENKAVILLKKEVSYGVDPVPTAADDALLVGPVKWEVETGDIERKVVLPWGGKLADIPVGKSIKISFPIEIFGSGTATTPPKHGPILLAAGFTQTIGASDVSYDENSNQDCDSVTIYWYEDGMLYKALGCVTASMKGDLAPRNTGVLECSFQGLFGGKAAMVSDSAIVSPTFGTLQTPPVLAATGSASFAIDSYSGIISKFGFQVENKVIVRPDANSAYGVKRLSLDPNGRKISGGVDPEMVALATYDPWNKWEGATLGACTITLGSSAGNRLVLNAPNVQKKVKLGSRDGLRTYDLSWEAVVTTAAGNNRLQFKFN